MVAWAVSQRPLGHDPVALSMSISVRFHYKFCTGFTWILVRIRSSFCPTFGRFSVLILVQTPRRIWHQIRTEFVPSFEQIWHRISTGFLSDPVPVLVPLSWHLAARLAGYIWEARFWGIWLLAMPSAIGKQGNE